MQILAPEPTPAAVSPENDSEHPSIAPGASGAAGATTKPPAGLRRFVTFPRLLSLTALVVYVMGAFWRSAFVLHQHDPRNHVFSDMEMYVNLGKRLAAADYVASVGDITHPPGLPWLMSWAYTHNPSLFLAVRIQLIVAILVPVAVGAVAALAFGRTTGLMAIVMSSLYFPFVDYAGLFLAEVYMMLFIPLCVALYLGAARVRSRWAAMALGLAAGIVACIACSFKAVALPALVGFAVLHWAFQGGFPAGPGIRAKMRAALVSRKTLVGLVFVFGLVPGIVALTLQCTRVSDGNVCLISNKGPADFLLGHYGRIKGIKWTAPDGGVFAFGNPSAVQRGYSEQKEVLFSMTDGRHNAHEAWHWVRHHPLEAFTLSLEHVYDLLGSTFTWPSIWGDSWPGVELAQFMFTYLLFLPSLVLTIDVLRMRGIRGWLASNELAVLSPFFGLVLGVMIATGEPRYRLPFDGLFIVLAMEFYRRLPEMTRALRAARLATPGLTTSG